MNHALIEALEANGVRSYPERIRFSLDIGVSEVTLRRWIQGENTPHIEFQKKAARKLGVKREQLWP